MIGKVVREFLPQADLLPYVEAILGAYNLLGRRDNKYKARIKITVFENGIDEIRRLRRGGVPAPPRRLRRLGPGDPGARSRPPSRRPPSATARPTASRRRKVDPMFRAWADTNLAAHRRADHAIVTISLKEHGATPGDATAEQMRLMADLAERYGYGELRISHEQNVILPHVHRADLPVVHAELRRAGLATANVGLISDIIACPGMDYCALATARSIPIAQEIATRFEELKVEHDVGPLKIKISGCINACGHHHVGHIGILGLDRAGVENYQITLGGDAHRDGGHRREDGPRLPRRRDRAGASSGSSGPTSRSCARGRTRRSSRPTAASGWSPSRASLYGGGEGACAMPLDSRRRRR